MPRRKSCKYVSICKRVCYVFDKTDGGGGEGENPELR